MLKRLLLLLVPLLLLVRPPIAIACVTEAEVIAGAEIRTDSGASRTFEAVSATLGIVGSNASAAAFCSESGTVSASAQVSVTPTGLPFVNARATANAIWRTQVRIDCPVGVTEVTPTVNVVIDAVQPTLRCASAGFTSALAVGPFGAWHRRFVCLGEDPEVIGIPNTVSTGVEHQLTLQASAVRETLDCPPSDPTCTPVLNERATASVQLGSPVFLGLPPGCTANSVGDASIVDNVSAAYMPGDPLSPVVSIPVAGGLGRVVVGAALLLWGVRAARDDRGGLA